MTDPASIRRADLLAALDLLGINSPAGIARIVIDPYHVTITEHVRSLTGGGILLNADRSGPVTVITRIEIQ